MKTEHNLNQWGELFEKIDPVLHAINCVADCVDFETMSSYRSLKTAVMEHDKPLPGSIMGIHASHWVNIALHANQLPEGPHKDLLSNHSGFDGISSFGPFARCYICFPHLGIRLEVRPFDVCLLRGAALFHHMYRWSGDGRFVVVPFVDRHLFPTRRVKKPMNGIPIFGAKHKAFRGTYPAKPLPTFE